MHRSHLFIVFALLFALSSSAGATPQLQLFLDPSLNPGAFYDTGEEGWVTGAGEVTVSAFMRGQVPGDTYQLIVSTPGYDPIADAMAVPVISSSSGAALGRFTGWFDGTPVCCGGTLPGHGIFPDEYALYDFSFTGPTTTIFNVQDTTFNPDGSIDDIAGAKTGYRADFVMTLPEGTHLDLINATATGVPNGKQKAPFSKDASIGPGHVIPEPSGALVFGVGSLLVSWRLRRRA